jgi:hypothetical protein
MTIGPESGAGEPVGFGWTKGAAAWAALNRREGSTFGSAIIPSMNSSGVMAEWRAALAATAFMAAEMIAVALFGVPGACPPRRSPGFDPLGFLLAASAAAGQITDDPRSTPSAEGVITDLAHTQLALGHLGGYPGRPLERRAVDIHMPSMQMANGWYQDGRECASTPTKAR